MQTTVDASGKTFTLKAQTATDRALLDALDDSRTAHTIAITRVPAASGYINDTAQVLIDRYSAPALEAQTARQFLRAFRELMRLGLGEDALHGHIGLDTPNPETHHKLAALFKQLQLVLDLGAVAVCQPKPVRQEIDSTHTTSDGQSSIVGQEGGAA